MDFGLRRGNFQGFTPTEFVLNSMTPFLYKNKTPMKLKVTLNLESLIGRNITDTFESDLFRLSSVSDITEADKALHTVYTVDILRGSKILMQVKISYELENGKLTDRTQYWAYLVDDKVIQLKNHHYPILLDNSSWKIQKDEPSTFGTNNHGSSSTVSSTISHS